MDDNAIRNLMYSINLIATNLNTRPDSWREQLQAVRYTTSSHEFTDTVPSESRKRWQVPMVDVFQRVAFADADNGAVQDVADWCLRQLLTLHRLYPQDVTVLRLIGRNWLLRAQRSLANIHRAERGSSSSSGASASAPQPEGQEQQENRTRTLTDVEDRTQGADYVEARGILVPATEYFQRAVTATYASGNVEGVVLADAAEAQMSLGNVTSTRTNDSHFRQAIYYLRAAAAVPGYSLPAHLQQYLAEHGSLYA